MRTKHLTENKVFKCEECSSTFKENRSLLHHQRRKHNPDKPVLICPVCGKEFAEKKNLRRHEKKHES